MIYKLLPAIVSGVLSHVLFHFIYPSSISIPIILSALLSALSVLPRSDPVRVQGTSDVVLAFGTYVFTLFFSIVAYRLSPFHPLAKYPGPAIAKVTMLWGVWNVWKGRRHHDLLQLHQTYGQFVRTGPNEISVTDVKAVTDVLGAGGIPKGDYYTVRKDPSAPNNILAMTGEDHDNRRRLWNRGMGNDSLQEYEPVIARRGTELVDRLKIESRRDADGTVDLVRWIDYFTFDFMGSMAFGNDFHLTTEGEDKHGVMNLLNEFVHAINVSSYLPWALQGFMKYPPFARKIIAFRKVGIDSARARVQAGAEVKDLWYHLSDEAELEKTRPSIPNVIADGTLAMVAGSDTTATTLAAFFYFVLHDSECYKRLREEIDSVYPPGSDAMDASRHEQLVWVKACMNETLRLAPPIPTNGPRQVPYKSQGAMVAGRFVPPGTQVCVPPYALHRDPCYFSPSPESFKPSRWLTSELSDSETGASVTTADGAILNHLAFIPFSYGPANCVGKGLARLEICMIICALIHKFDFALADGIDQKRWLGDLRDNLVMSRESLWVKVVERAA